MALPGRACFVLLLVADAALKRLRGSSLVANRRAAADRKCTRVRLRRPTFRPSQMDALPWTRRRSVVAICAGRWYTRTVPRERTPAQVVCREGALMHTGDVTVCKPRVYTARTHGSDGTSFLKVTRASCLFIIHVASSSPSLRRCTAPENISLRPEARHTRMRCGALIGRSNRLVLIPVSDVELHEGGCHLVIAGSARH